MRAVVVYESMFGNTRAVAEALASGLTGFDVAIVPIGAADVATTDGADLVVVGAPTHVFGLSRQQTRTAAADQAAESGGALVLEPGATGPGVREWLDVLPRSNRRAVVFDTRVKGARLGGHAAPKIAKQLGALGWTIADEPRSFFVTKQNELRPGELDGARAWGQALAAQLHSADAASAAS